MDSQKFHITEILSVLHDGTFSISGNTNYFKLLWMMIGQKEENPVFAADLLNKVIEVCQKVLSERFHKLTKSEIIASCKHMDNDIIAIKALNQSKSSTDRKIVIAIREWTKSLFDLYGIEEHYFIDPIPQDYLQKVLRS